MRLIANCAWVCANQALALSGQKQFQGDGEHQDIFFWKPPEKTCQTNHQIWNKMVKPPVSYYAEAVQKTGSWQDGEKNVHHKLGVTTKARRESKVTNIYFIQYMQKKNVTGNSQTIYLAMWQRS